MCKCYFCDSTTETPADDEWTPGFWDGTDDEIAYPVCPQCTDEKLVVCSDGEMELKPKTETQPC